jgi:hypothetical protein
MLANLKHQYYSESLKQFWIILRLLYNVLDLDQISREVPEDVVMSG